MFKTPTEIIIERKVFSTSYKQMKFYVREAARAAVPTTYGLDRRSLDCRL